MVRKEKGPALRNTMITFSELSFVLVMLIIRSFNVGATFVVA